jgi:hypothetical protein
MIGVGGFGSWHCFGVAVACAAMASAKGVGENLFRLPCGGQLLDESLFISRVQSQFYLFSLKSPLSKDTLSCPSGDT